MNDTISRQAALDALKRAEALTRAMADLIETAGLDEEIRCAMCTNPMHNENGCDGACQYDERLYQKIMSVLKERITAEGAWNYCPTCGAIMDGKDGEQDG